MHCIDPNQELFRVDRVSKSYAMTAALQDVSFSINRGEIVGLVGENGAGKSTLLKIMMGVTSADKGSMTFMGQPYAPKNTREANDHGVGMVFQEQSLIKNLTVAQNIFLGDEDQFRHHGCVSWSSMATEAKQVLNKLGLSSINPNKRIADIQFSRRQMVEIVKVLHRISHGRDSGAIILLDEPTSVLNGKEIQTLFDKMRELKEDGNGVVFISHRLDEIMTICDRIFVFKDGQNVCNMPVKQASEPLLYEKMVGKSSAKEFYKNSDQKPVGEKVLIQTQGLGVFGHVHNVDLTLHEGEILGICGVIGSGKEILCRVLNGDIPHTSGTLTVLGKEKNFGSPHQALHDGIVSIPTERRVEGQVGIASIEDNIIYSNIKKVSKHHVISKKLQRDLALSWIKDLRIKCQGPEQRMEGLSGGNAQKVVFARVLASDAHIIILNHPTRGVDVGAKEEIYEIIREASSKGIGIILLGDTLDECIGLSHRIMVMKDGVVTQMVNASADDKPEQVEILRHMM